MYANVAFDTRPYLSLDISSVQLKIGSVNINLFGVTLKVLGDIRMLGGSKGPLNAVHIEAGIFRENNVNILNASALTTTSRVPYILFHWVLFLNGSFLLYFVITEENFVGLNDIYNMEDVTLN